MTRLPTLRSLRSLLLFDFLSVYSMESFKRSLTEDVEPVEMTNSRTTPNVNEDVFPDHHRMDFQYSVRGRFRSSESLNWDYIL